MSANKDLERAILESLAYSDIFNFPLRTGELSRYLPVPLNGADLEAAIAGLDGRVQRTDGFHHLAGRAALVPVRQGREALSRRAMRRAVFFGRVLGVLPFVRMVAVTGSLAVLNCEHSADLDYMLVARSGRVWLARAVALAFNRVTRLFGNTICPNLIVSEDALEWQRRDLYAAREVCQMLPIVGHSTYGALRAANKWTEALLPNAAGTAADVLHRSGIRVRAAGVWESVRCWFQRILELPLLGVAGDRLEAWEMNRKVARFTRQSGYGPETVFNADICQGNFNHHGARTMLAYRERLAALGLVSENIAGAPQSGAVGAGEIKSASGATVLFGQSYYLRFDPKLWEAMQPYPPLGTLYAASYVRDRGYTVALFDAMLAESEQEWAEALERQRPRFAVIFEDNFNYLSKMCLLRMREAAFTMIAMARARGCTVILCGADATDHAEDYAARGADFILLGEGEETLGELLDQLTGRTERNFASIRGLAYVDDGSRTMDNPSAAMVNRPSTVVRNSRRPDIKNLDALPFPAWDLVDVDRYRKVWLERHGFYSMNMVTTRGCPYHCNWCAKPIWGQRYNSRSPENVAAEMKWIKETYQPDHIWFADDILGLKPGWIEKFSALLNADGAVIPFKCLQRADLVTEKVAAALASAGCRSVWVGAESGSQKILDAMEKGDTVEDIYTAARLLHAHGIEVGFFLQFGYPGESWEDIRRTLQMVRDCAPDDIGISVSYPLPGTKFHERVKLELGEKQNWVDSDDLAMLYRGPFPGQFYRVLHGRVHHEFRLRRAWRRRSLKTLIRVPYHYLGQMRSEIRLRRMIRMQLPEAARAGIDIK